MTSETFKALHLSALDLTTKQTQHWYAIEWREGKTDYVEVFFLAERAEAWADARVAEGHATIIYPVISDERASREEVATLLRENSRLSKYFPVKG